MVVLLISDTARYSTSTLTNNNIENPDKNPLPTKNNNELLVEQGNNLEKNPPIYLPYSNLRIPIPNHIQAPNHNNSEDKHYPTKKRESQL